METYNVVDADSSQIAVIEDAKKGHSLVVEGPPGTGKSQTIVNLISELLANEKKILFVSEKMAALEVVKKRMDSVKLLTVMLTIILGIVAMLIIILGIVYITSKLKQQEVKKPIETKNGKLTKKTKKFKEYKIDSIMNFLEFDTVIDNMISQKDGNR